MLGKGQMALRMIFKKTLILHKVLYIPNIRKNLSSENLHVSRSYKIVLQSNKLIITRNNKFVGEDFVLEGTF